MNWVNSRNDFGHDDSTINIVVVIIIITTVIFFHSGTKLPGNDKITLCNTKKYKNQAGINLTSPFPSCSKMALYRWIRTESRWNLISLSSPDWAASLQPSFERKTWPNTLLLSSLFIRTCMFPVTLTFTCDRVQLPGVKAKVFSEDYELKEVGTASSLWL